MAPVPVPGWRRALRSAALGLALGAGLGMAVVLLPAGRPATAWAAEGVATASTAPANAAPATPEELAELAARRLLVPVEGVAPSALRDTFKEARDAGARPHDAIDIPAPRGTPVLAVEDGQLVKLFTSVPGGLTIYQFDPSGRWAYYYAHLDRYAQGLQEGMNLKRGQVIGHVGSTGNASPDAPHLHFAIFRLGPQRQWWRGEAVNPYPVLAREEAPR